jgi:acetylornithine deacetylase
MTELESTELWRILDRLVAFDTVPSASNVSAAEYLADLLDEADFQVRIHRDHALGADKASVVAWAGPPRPDGLILSGHMDVVPFVGQPGWTRDPLVLARDDERVYGRGVADMKAFLGQCVVVARQLDLSRLSRPLVLLFTCDEEVGCLGAGRLVPQLERHTGNLPLPREAVIGEPTAFRVYSAHKGHVQFSVSVTGRGGHSSRPDLGTNAIAAMAEAARALTDLAADLEDRGDVIGRQLFPDFPATPVNLGTVRGGSAVNMIPELCEMTVGIRPLPDEDPLELFDEAAERMERAVRTRFPDADLKLHDLEVTPAMQSPRTGRVPTILGRLTDEHEFLGAPYATDGGQFARLGINSYICGPGELEQAHQPDESLSIASLVGGVDLVERLVSEVCCSERDD